MACMPSRGRGKAKGRPAPGLRWPLVSIAASQRDGQYVPRPAVLHPREQPVFMPTSAPVHTLLAEGQHSLAGDVASRETNREFCTLAEAYKLFDSSAHTEGSKHALQQLHQRLHAAGLAGRAVLDALQRCKHLVGWESMDAAQFTSFYRFVFFTCRELPLDTEHQGAQERERRNIEMDVAVQAWQLLLKGRFRLLEKWCAFASHSGRLIVTDDTWSQVLDFSRTVHEDLGNYDLSSAWPVLLDEFVEGLRARGSSSKLAERNHPAAGLELDASLSASCSSSLMVPVSPCCGSKRRALDVDNVTEQLQQMPLVSQAAPTSPSHPSRPRLKRLCGRRSPLSTPQPATSSHSLDTEAASPMSEGHSPMWSGGWDVLRSPSAEPQRLSAMHVMLQQTVQEALDLA